jgi:hypothetical protein
MFQWLGEVHLAADRYYDWLLSVISQDAFYEQNRGERGRWLMLQRPSHSTLPAGTFAVLLERCRHFSQGRA